MSVATLLVLARCAGFAFRAPGFSHPSVPHIVRVGIALALTVAIAPSVHVRSTSGIEMLLACVLELGIGSAIGIGASVLYDGAFAGGRMVDDYVGVKAVAPNLDLVAPSGFGRIWASAFTGGFFVFGAYRVTLLAFAASFARVAPGVPLDGTVWSHYAATLTTTIVLVALAVAAPAIALAFVTQIALAALARTIPRFASFTLSFPLVFGVVLVATAISVPLMALRAGSPIVFFTGVTR